MPETMPLHLVVAHLDDHLGPHGRLLELSAAPAVRLGEAPLRGVLEQRQHGGGDLVVARGCHRGRADVVERAVVVPEPEEERGDPAVVAALPAEARHDAVGGLLRLDLHDRGALAGAVRLVAALCDHPVEADRLERLEPLERLRPRQGVRREDEAGRDVLEGRPPIGERRAPVLDPVPDEHVEGDEARRDLRGELANPALRRVEPRLHRVEVEDAVADDHDLAVEARAGREQLAERHELGEVAEERPRVPRPEAKLAGGVLEEAAEAVPLRLVLPLVAVRQLTHELGFHRGERDCGIEVGGPLDGLARPAPAGTCHRGHRTAE